MSEQQLCCLLRLYTKFIYDRIKRIAAICAVTLMTYSVSAQKTDLGFVYSSDSEESAAFELRTQLSDRYKLREALSRGVSTNFFHLNGQVASSTDTSVTFGNFDNSQSVLRLRIGTQRRLTDSHFSVGADVVLGYDMERRKYYETLVYRDDQGRYVGLPILEIPYGELPASRVNQHYFTPGLRLSLNLDLPLVESLLVHLSASQLTSAPIYMGATEFDDPFDQFSGTPAGEINLSMAESIRLRYIFNQKKQ